MLERAGKSGAAIAQLRAGWHLPPVGGGVLRRKKLRDLPGNVVNPHLQEKSFIDFHANEPMTGKRQLSKGATP
jgi:hypothetical protein